MTQHFLKRAVLMALILFSAGTQAAQRELLDFSWRFSTDATHEATAANFNDKEWRTVDLPHDWSIEGTPEQSNPMGNDGGYYPAGTGCYRRLLTITPEQLKGRIELCFEGVYERSEVYVNGQLAGSRPYGYVPFTFDITSLVHAGADNVVAVWVDNSKQKNCRWYSGSGIYRHVWLRTSDNLHLTENGVRITTPTTTSAEAEVSVTNNRTSPCEVSVSMTIEPFGEAKTTIKLDANSTAKATLSLLAADAKPWSVDEPNLYTAKFSLSESGKVVDTEDVTMGFRTIEYNAEDGLLLNGKAIELNGCCVHHDNGMLGVRAFDRAEEWRVELIKKGGFNAVRTAHNLPSEAFLNACDRIGLLVIDEALDGWREHKNENVYDYSTLFDEWWKTDVQAMVLRDRNHPSIFCWSIGNEVIERKDIRVVTTARQLVAAVKECDPTRPVTSALATWDADWEIYDPLAEAHDIVGYNYVIFKAQSDHARDPKRVMIQTESNPKDAFRNWETLTEKSYVIGDFVWTGLDYLGESGIGRYWYSTDTPGEHWQSPLFPWHGSYCGDVDICGWRKPISHYRDMIHNGTEEIYMAVREPNNYFGKGDIFTGQWAVWPTWECWNWPGHEGKPIEVEVVSRYKAVRLYLDDKLIGEQPTDQEHGFRAVFTLPYAEGTLRACGTEEGSKSVSLSTAGAPYAIKAVADRSQISADGQDLSFINIEVVDAQGRPVPNAEPVVKIATQGKASLVAAGNANLQDLTPFNTTQPQLWKGKAMAVVRAPRTKGKTTITISAEGLKPCKVNIEAK